LKFFFYFKSKLRYSRPESAPPSPSVSRASTPAHFEEDDDESDETDNEDPDTKSSGSIGSSSNKDSHFKIVVGRTKSQENISLQLDKHANDLDQIELDARKED
jgi:hypothetical protein